MAEEQADWSTRETCEVKRWISPSVYSILFYSILFSCWEDVMSVIWLQCTRVRSSKYIEILVFLQFCVCAERTDAVEDSLVAAAQV